VHLVDFWPARAAQLKERLRATEDPDVAKTYGAVRRGVLWQRAAVIGAGLAAAAFAFRAFRHTTAT